MKTRPVHAKPTTALGLATADVAYALKRIDMLVRVCEAVVEETNPMQKAKLLGMLALVAGVEVDEESIDAS